MPRVTANGLQIEVQEAGPKTGPAIVMVMGLGAQLTQWQPDLIDGLAAKGYRVVRFDNRDCGLSSKLDSAGPPDLMSILTALQSGRSPLVPYGLNDMAADTVGVLDALSIEKAHVVGASMGGMIAQLTAAHYPDRVSSLVSIMSSSGDPTLPQADPEVMMLLMRPAPPAVDREACIRSVMEFWTAVSSPAYPASEAELRAKAEVAIDRCYYPEGTGRQMAAILSSGSRVDILPKISAPALVVHGRADRLVPLAGGEDTARRIPNARLQIIEGMGHDFTTAIAPVYLQAIGDFVDEVEGKA